MTTQGINDSSALGDVSYVFIPCPSVRPPVSTRCLPLTAKRVGDNWGTTNSAAILLSALSAYSNKFLVTWEYPMSFASFQKNLVPPFPYSNDSRLGPGDRGRIILNERKMSDTWAQILITV